MYDVISPFFSIITRSQKNMVVIFAEDISNAFVNLTIFHFDSTITQICFQGLNW